MANYINGVSYPDGNISIKNNQVFINGVLQTGKEVESKTINIVIEGDSGDLVIDSINSLKIKGNSGYVETTNGTVSIEGSVSGNVRTTNGTVNCRAISGSVKTTNGSVNHR